MTELNVCNDELTKKLLRSAMCLWRQKIMLVQGHPVVLGQKRCYRREEGYLFYLNSSGSYFMLFVKYSLFFIRKLA